MTGFAAGMGVYFAAVTAIYVLFLGARALVAKLAGVPGRLGPFGEAPLDRIARAPAVVRLALALIGPAAIYGLVVALLALTIHSGGEMKEESTLIDGVSGPAAEAGLRDGDRIKAVDGQPVAAFDEIRPLIAAHAGERIDVMVERDGRLLRIPVTPGPLGSVWEGRLGVHHAREQMTLGAAFRSALPQPLEMLGVRLHPKPRITQELAGPIAITQSVAGGTAPSRAELSLKMAALAGVGALDCYLLLALFLFPYRRRQIATPLALSPAPPRPWLRFAARVVDLAVFVLALSLPAVAINPGLPDAAGNSLLLLTIPIEAALLATWGTTPGKALLGISVRDAGGGKLSFGAALRRAAAVWTFGLAANQSIMLVTGLMSWSRLRRRGAAYWDALDGHRVDHDDPPGWRISVAVGIVLLVIAFNIAVQVKAGIRDL